MKRRVAMRSYLIPLLLIWCAPTLLVSGCKKDEIKFDTMHPGDNVPIQFETPFEHVPASTDIVMYEVNLRAFSASGDLKGVEARLDSIKKLGINVIWLMPIYPIGELNAIGSPYAVRDYKSINADFGKLADLRELVRQAHQRDMAVILDWVANHTAWDHPWIQNKSWYTQDASGNIISPNTWTDVADLNYGNEAMRQEMIKAMKYWVLEANVDGYRCDYAEGVPLDFWEQAIDTLHHIPARDLIMFAEAKDKGLFSSGFDLTFGWNYYNKLKDVFNGVAPLSDLSTVNAADYINVPQGSNVLRWITNHDDNAWDNTPINIFHGREGSMAAFVLTSFMGGVPLIYNGQEVGCPIQLSFFKGGNTKINWEANADLTSEYQKLISIRKESNAIRNGSLEVMGNSPDVISFKRTSGNEEFVIIVNVRSTSVNYSLPSSLAHTSWVDAMTGGNTDLQVSLSMPPFRYIILKKT
ncbi:MAG: alpha-amylase family glycosyl hydrolase [Saprospiraceae bacterium]